MSPLTPIGSAAVLPTGSAGSAGIWSACFEFKGQIVCPIIFQFLFFCFFKDPPIPRCFLLFFSQMENKSHTSAKHSVWHVDAKTENKDVRELKWFHPVSNFERVFYFCLLALSVPMLPLPPIPWPHHFMAPVPWFRLRIPMMRHRHIHRTKTHSRREAFTYSVVFKCPRTTRPSFLLMVTAIISWTFMKRVHHLPSSCSWFVCVCVFPPCRVACIFSSCLTTMQLAVCAFCGWHSLNV